VDRFFRAAIRFAKFPSFARQQVVDQEAFQTGEFSKNGEQANDVPLRRRRTANSHA
jgi:hypothetical protein